MASVGEASRKRRMADAAGEVDIFLDTYQGPQQQLESIASLRQGMKLCQQRQIYLKMMAGNYRPRMLPCDLYNFGTSLASAGPGSLQARTDVNCCSFRFCCPQGNHLRVVTSGRAGRGAHRVCPSRTHSQGPSMTGPSSKCPVGGRHGGGCCAVHAGAVRRREGGRTPSL